MKILSVNVFDTYSGAERCVQNLHRNLGGFGHESWLAVGFKRTADARTIEIPNDARRSRWARTWLSVENFLRSQHFFWRLCPSARMIGQPRRTIRTLRGFEDFDFPATRELPDLPPERPDVLHLHVLQGGFFDLRKLPLLTAEIPTILTLHDGWLYTGHCAYSLNCDRWRHGCGECPDLTLPPSVPRDKTAENWQLKNRLFEQSGLHLCTPSHWLMRRTKESILIKSAVTTHVVPYGIETAVFRPIDKQEARAKLNLPGDRPLVLFSGTNVTLNPYKDSATILESMKILSARSPHRKPICLLLGEKKARSTGGEIEYVSIPHQRDPAIVAAYYSAADIYIHASRRDNLPFAILEASACGAAVVATAVGGIQEEVRSLKPDFLRHTLVTAHSLDSATGILVTPGNSEEMASAVDYLLGNPEIRNTLGRNGSEFVRRNFASEVEVRRYISVYEDAIAEFSSRRD